MKILHCADVHLDSEMGTNLDRDKAKERRNELLVTFQNMIKYAKDENIKHIIIAGDLYDKKNIRSVAKDVICGAIKNNSDITFYYLKGNHDADAVLASMDTIPANLKMFDSNWSSYDIGDNVVISGIELNKDNSVIASNSLVLNPDNINIVTLHGQINEGVVKDKAEYIPLKNYKNKGIDYMALGHVHAYMMDKLDARGKYCYPGCLEGRGFDECGEHGFMVLDVDTINKAITPKFVPFAKRCIHSINVDITGCENTSDVQDKISEELTKEAIPNKDMVRVGLVGEVDFDCDINSDYLKEYFKRDYYAVRVKNESKLKVDYEAYANDASLKGEFIRLVNGIKDIDDTTKSSIIKYGIQTLTDGKIEEEPK